MTQPNYKFNYFHCKTLVKAPQEPRHFKGGSIENQFNLGENMNCGRILEAAGVTQKIAGTEIK